MGIFVEESSKMNCLQLLDAGTFTVQTSDIPLSLKRNIKRSWKKPLQQIRLTPIHESEETIGDVQPLAHLRSCGSGSPCSTTATDSTDLGVISPPPAPPKQKTFTYTRPKQMDPLDLNFLDEVDEELENILEIPVGARSMRDEANVLKTLPPRPKCQLKVLPPSVTDRGDNRSKIRPKKPLTLRRRCKSVNTLYKPDNAVVTPTKQSSGSIPSTESIIADLLERPSSTGSQVQVIQLSELKSVHSRSVPDLPTIVNNMAKMNELRQIQGAVYDDSGALATPRRPPEEPLGPVQWGSKCLRGSEIASFYNMWERDRTRRPFDRKQDTNKLQGLKVRRNCSCSLKNCVKQCRKPNLKPLPPIRT